jgi:hypothetical protein
MAETDRVQRKVRGSVVGPATKSQVPALLVNAMAEVQREENAKPRAARLAGTQKKHVAVNAVSTVVDEIDIPEEDRNAVKELLPELVDVIKSLLNGKSPALEVFASPENVSALVRLGKSIKSCFCCCRKKPASEPPVEVTPIEATQPEIAPADVAQSEEIAPADVAQSEEIAPADVAQPEQIAPVDVVLPADVEPPVEIVPADVELPAPVEIVPADVAVSADAAPPADKGAVASAV